MIAEIILFSLLRINYCFEVACQVMWLSISICANVSVTTGCVIGRDLPTTLNDRNELSLVALPSLNYLQT